MLKHFGERSAAGGLSHIPPRDSNAHRGTQVSRPGSDPAQRTDDDGAGAGQTRQFLGELRQKRIL